MRNFDAVRTEENYRWLVVGYTGVQDIPEPDLGDEIYYELMNEYSELDGNRQALDFYELQAEVSRLQVRQKVVDAILETMSLEIEDKTNLVAELTRWDLPFNLDNDFDAEMKTAHRTQKGWLTKINRKLAKLESLGKNEDGEELEETTILEQKIILEQVLEKNHIDLNIITATEFIYLRKTAQATVNKKRKWQTQN
tara:strand:- start:37047 stop:37634 length:588 start_codon:yes stop_codon:yes gene_type:complete